MPMRENRPARKLTSLLY